jgi:hypothetical protein
MRYPLFFVLPLCLVVSIAFAQQPKPPELCDGCEEIEEDQEPNWDTATYSCPLSIKTAKGEFKFRGYSHRYVSERGWKRRDIPLQGACGNSCGVFLGERGD